MGTIFNSRSPYTRGRTDGSQHQRKTMASYDKTSSTMKQSTQESHDMKEETVLKEIQVGTSEQMSETCVNSQVN